MMQHRSDGLLLTERTVEATRARAAAPCKGSSCRRQPWLEPPRRRGALGSLMGAAGGLADAARSSIASQATVTVGRPLASRMAPRHALQVPSLSKRTLHRGEGVGSAREVSNQSDMRFVSVAARRSTQERLAEAPPDSKRTRGPKAANCDD